MRRKNKKEIDNLIDTLKDAHLAIASFMEGENWGTSMELLMQCQECAIQIGTIIEKEAGEGTKAVSLLEKYCEKVFQISQMTIAKTAGSFCRQLSPLLEQVRSEIRDHIPESLLKIVFMPYKASMWDSLESIWEAANEDASCEAYVVPIPYFERDKAGNVSQICCERDLVPEYVPVIPYEEFLLEKEQPDVIYIHNPFDGANHVTSIHPDYYSNQLKKYTDMLVYVPYYIIVGSMPESHRNLPVYYYADKIILQNEHRIKEINDVISREKIVALGNPKTDKILKLCENPPQIPKGWESMICRADGTKNKVIMYNCSITGLLENSEKFLNKMEYIFRVAKGIDGITLLWRPHPLLEATITSMRPELGEKFRRIKEMFYNEKIGIYDETPDPAASIALCDAYIGEGSSSMVTMFGVAGKPIFILDMNIIKEEDNVTEEEMRALSFVDMAIEGEEAWFVSNRYQAVCKMDMNTGNSNMVARIPETERGLLSRYSYIYKKENKLYLTPLHTDGLCIYDIEYHTFRKIYFPDARLHNFCDILFYQDEIIFKPLGYEGVIRYNEQTGAYRRIDGFIEEYEGLCSHYDESLPRFGGRVRCEEDILWMACLQCNYVLKYDLRDDSWQYYEIGDKHNTYIDIICVEDDLWLLPYTGKAIVRWNRRTGECAEYIQYLDKIKIPDIGSIQLFREWYQNGKVLYAIPIHADNIIKVDTETCEMKVQDIGLNISISERKFDHWKAGSNYDFYKEKENYLILKLTYDESLLFINKSNMKLERRIPVRLSLQELRDLQGMEMKTDMKARGGFFGLVENIDFDSLPVFIEQIVEKNINKYHEQKRFYSARVGNMDGSAGKKIHEYIMAESI